jgi:hypothetical protein
VPELAGKIANPEIAKNKRIVFSDKNVVRLNISVDYVRFMKGSNCINQ